jgi:hypothetical protein
VREPQKPEVLDVRGKWVTVQDAAEWLETHYTRVYAWIREDRITTRKRNGKTEVRLDHAIELQRRLALRGRPRDTAQE